MIHRGGVNWLNARIYLTVLVERRQNEGHLASDSLAMEISDGCVGGVGEEHQENTW